MKVMLGKELFITNRRKYRQFERYAKATFIEKVYYFNTFKERSLCSYYYDTRKQKQNYDAEKWRKTVKLQHKRRRH